MHEINIGHTQAAWLEILVMHRLLHGNKHYLHKRTVWQQTLFSTGHMATYKCLPTDCKAANIVHTQVAWQQPVVTVPNLQCSRSSRNNDALIMTYAF